MTYPPQQPGPYGQDPYGRPQQPPPSPPYGHQPPPGQPPYGGQPSPPYGQPQQPPPGQPPFGGQPSYQGLGGYGPGGPGGPGGPPEPPKKRNTGMIVAIVVIVLLVLGGGGVALIVLNKDDDKNTAGTTTTESTKQSEPEESASEAPPGEDEEPTDEGGSGDASNSPEDVREAYMAAYESKSFGEVVNGACDAYKEEYGTDTSKLEQQLEPFTITAKADGEPKVVDKTATANITLELSQDGNKKPAKIFIKIVEEEGEWRFCGEGEAA